METGDEIFSFLAFRWNVTKAKKVARELPVVDANVSSWFGWVDAVRLNEDFIPEADLSQPLIVVRIQEAGGEPMIIDGWHRLAKAKREDMSVLPVVILDETQELEVRVYGGEKGFG